jgi:eukaryotic-like serine/threonine-protein kinase
MGEVYRARDPQLKRDVAIKILPADITIDADRLARFQREAEVLASLNHTNIAHVFGIAEAGGVRGIVMELAEGGTLAHMLSGGPLPLGEALGIARQVADALEMAHDRGIVHRDLKPANIAVTHDGVVKVLDFGLAKALNPVPDATANAATFSSPAMTRAGIILGTAAYMSPEQARGRAVDARTDIWAFGCVLFEMITGRRPFDGETVTDILGAIVHKEPEWSLLPGTLPDSLRRLLERCLAKDPKQRLRNIADVGLEIQDLLTRPQAAVNRTGIATASLGRARMTGREATAWAIVVALSIVGAALGWMRPSSNGSATPFRLSMLHVEGGEVGVPVISPDGRRVAYSARRVDGMPMVWVRDLDRPTPRPLAGTEGGNRLFWSPDSKRLGFVVGAVMKQISADGGPVQVVERGVGGGASWAIGNDIIFANANGQMLKVDASGGEAVAVTTLQGPDWGHYWPSMLPDGRRFLFTAKHWAGLAESGAQGIYLGSIDSPSDIRQLLPDLSSAVYAPPGFVVFARDGQVMAAPFDLAGGRIRGEPVPLAEAVAIDASFYLAGLSAAADGTLAIRPPPAALASSATGAGAFDGELTFIRRDGSVSSRFGGVQKFFEDMAMSPDGKAVATLVQDTRTSGSELWRIDVESGARTPLTSMRTSGGYVGAPVWSSDGTRVAFACQPPGILDDVCIRDLASGVVTTAIQSKAIWEHPVAWSPDGQSMIVAFNEFTASSREELRVWSERTKTLSPFVATGNDAAFSPDGRFVAFTSPESGRAEVYVTMFPERRQTWPITTEGGYVVSWSADGKELLVATLTGHIVGYPVTAGDTFSAGAPQVLVRNVGFDARYALATRDHSRLLIRVPKDVDKDRGEIRLLSGWANGLAAQGAR